MCTTAANVLAQASVREAPHRSATGRAPEWASLLWGVFDRLIPENLLGRNFVSRPFTINPWAFAGVA